MKTKYKIGNFVWYMKNNTPSSAQIEKIVVVYYPAFMYNAKLEEYSNKPKILCSVEYKIGNDSYKESEIFNSKKELVESLL